MEWKIVQNLNILYNFKFNEDNAYLINKNYIPTNLTASIHCGLLNSNFFSNFTKLYEDIFVNKSKFGLIEDKIKYLVSQILLIHLIKTPKG